MRLIDLICPLSCRGCGRLGAVCCARCKKYNILECETDGLCDSSDLEKIYVVGRREGMLKQLVADLKYNSVRAAAEVLAELLDERIPDTQRMVIVPLPTIGKHVRERGLNHTLEIAKKLAKRKGWCVEEKLRRAMDTVQVGAKAKMRKVQAAKAYEVNGKVDDSVTYLLLDDVWTTGASIKAAAAVLKKAGAKHIRAAVVAVTKD